MLRFNKLLVRGGGYHGKYIIVETQGHGIVSDWMIDHLSSGDDFILDGQEFRWILINRFIKWIRYIRGSQCCHLSIHPHGGTRSRPSTQSQISTTTYLCTTYTLSHPTIYPTTQLQKRPLVPTYPNTPSHIII